MTIDKQIEEALEELKAADYLTDGRTVEIDLIYSKAIQACLQAILEDDWHTVELGVEDVTGSKEIKTRVKELLESKNKVLTKEILDEK